MSFKTNKRVARSVTAGLLTAGLMLGGLTAPSAMAGGGGGNRPGQGGGSTDVLQFWQYKDDASGSWGSASDIQSVHNAMNAAGVSMNTAGEQAASAVLADARTECESGFKARHPGEGNGDCRVVAVGAVPVGMNGGYVYEGTGWYDKSEWINNWNNFVANNWYNYAGTNLYKTSYAFNDDPNNSVDKIMTANVTATAQPSLVIIVLDKYQPAPPETAPAAPTKSIERGTSADSMRNTTAIASGTGVGGTVLDFQDVFRPNGVAYTVENLKVTDMTDGSDRTGDYTFNTQSGGTPADDVLTATYQGGKLPDNHDWAFTFDVVVSKPSTSRVEDTGNVHWHGSSKDQREDTPSYEFPTWKPNPDKAWVQGSNPWGHN